MEKFEKTILVAAVCGIIGFLMAGSASVLSGSEFSYSLAFSGFFGGIILGYFFLSNTT